MAMVSQSSYGEEAFSEINSQAKGLVMSENLVVISKVKKFIKDTAGMNTSANAFDVLTKIVEQECLKAIEKAKCDKRKTVKDRDFIQPL